MQPLFHPVDRFEELHEDSDGRELSPKRDLAQVIMFLSMKAVLVETPNREFVQVGEISRFTSLYERLETVVVGL